MLTEKTLNILREKAAQYKVKRLLLFGSCLDKPEAEAGDIDLAVEGIDGEDFWSFYHEIFFDDGIKKEIDLVDMSKRVSIVPIIRESNVVIYES